MKNLLFYIKKYRYPLLILFFTLLFFWKVVLHPTYFLYYSKYYQSDLVEQHSFWYLYIKGSFEKFGYFPLWNPYVFGGVPFFASNFSQLFYPLAPLFLFFPADAFFAHYYLINFFLGGLSVYLLVRTLKLDKFSSFIAAIIYIFNARTVAYIFSGEVMMMSVLVIVPLIFLFAELSVQRNRFFYGIFVAILIAFVIVGAHLQYVFYIYFYLSLYFLFRLYFLHKESKKPYFYAKPMLIFFFIVIFSILLSSIQFLPNLELSKYHIRSNKISYGYSSTTSLPFKHLITLLVPTFFGSFLNDTYWGAYSYWSLAIYLGILPLILALISFFKKSRYVVFFAFMAVLSLFIAFGKYTPVHYLFFKFVPGFNFFRVPSRILFFFIFSSSILAGFGANVLITNKKILPFLSKILLIAFAVSLLSFAVVYFAKPAILSYGASVLKQRYSISTLELEPLENYSQKIEPAYNWIAFGFLVLALILLSIAVLFMLKLRNKISDRKFKILLFLIIIIDLWVYSMPYISLKDPKEIFSKTDIVKFFDNDKSLYRVLDTTEYPYALPQHIAGRYNIDLVTGYDAIVLRYYYEYLGKMGNLIVQPSTTIPIKNIAYPQLADLLNAKYIISSEKLDDSRYDLKFSNDKFLVYLNKKYLPRAFTVPNAIVLNNRNDILDKLISKEFIAKEAVILEDFPEGNLKNLGEFQEAAIDYYSPHKITVKANLEHPSFLILSETWYPGWKAYDNGKETRVYKADYVLRAVYLDKGNHNVDFVFEPESFKLGIKITLASLFLAVVLLIIFWKYRI